MVEAEKIEGAKPKDLSRIELGTLLCLLISLNLFWIPDRETEAQGKTGAFPDPQGIHMF